MTESLKARIQKNLLCGNGPEKIADCKIWFFFWLEALLPPPPPPPPPPPFMRFAPSPTKHANRRVGFYPTIQPSPKPRPNYPNPTPESPPAHSP